MDMTGEYRIAAPREKVWEALNDPEVLQKSIPAIIPLCFEIIFATAILFLFFKNFVVISPPGIRSSRRACLTICLIYF